ncbi:MAG: class I SAM-dependent methyltransferase [Alphaproteobacteria bacterium]
MAITMDALAFMTLMRRSDLLPQGGTILELGQAEWYGDADPLYMLDALECTGDERERIQADIATARQDLVEADAQFGLNSRERYAASARVVDLFYTVFFGTADRTAVDLKDCPGCLRLDLNEPHDLGRRFDVVVNNGTAEHIFNIGNVFKFMHDHTAQGGVMVHEMPFHGYVDHGFYNIQPTLLFDLAASNSYKFVMMVRDTEGRFVVLERREVIWGMYEKGMIRRNSNIFAVLRKDDTSPFQVPQQGVYAGRYTADQDAVWRLAMRDV